MLNRRDALQSGLAIPLFGILKPKNRIQEIAEHIEKDFVENLSKKCSIISSLKDVKIYNDLSSKRWRNISGFYGWVGIRLHEITEVYPKPYKNPKLIKETEYILNLINNYRYADYGYTMELDVLLNEKETNQVLDILWKKAGYEGYKA